MVVGAVGSGKSSLLAALIRQISIVHGHVKVRIIKSAIKTPGMYLHSTVCKLCWRGNVLNMLTKSAIQLYRVRER